LCQLNLNAGTSVPQLACLHVDKRIGLFGKRLLSSQSEQLKKLSKGLIGWTKSSDYPANQKFNKL